MIDKFSFLNKKKYDYIIAIDPDVTKSGIASIDIKGINIELKTLSFVDIIDFLQQKLQHSRQANYTFIVVVEAGWLNRKSCFHIAQGRKAERIAKNVGSNHEVGKLIVEKCEHLGIDVVEQKPLKKYWKGPNGKITHTELSEFISALPCRSNQETRDALLLAWNYANLPIRINSSNNKKRQLIKQ